MNSLLGRVTKRVGAMVATLAVIGGSVTAAASSAVADSAESGYKVGASSRTSYAKGSEVVVSAPATQFTYTPLGGGTARIDGCVGSCPNAIEIPVKVDGLTVVSIADNAFIMSGLTAVSFETSSVLEAIGEYAFAQNDLTSVNLPSSVTTISEYAFVQNGLTSANIPSNVTTIGNAAFALNGLRSVSIPSNVTTVGAYAFRGNSISRLVVPANVTTIGDYAFFANGLESLSIEDVPGNPSRLTSIGGHAFRGSSLDEVSIPASVKSIGQQAFDANGMATLSFARDGALTDIGQAAFRGNNLEAVEVPSSVTQVGTHAFANNETLKSVVFMGGQPEFGNDVFLGTPSDPIFVKGQRVSPSWSYVTVGGRSIKQVPAPQILSQPVGGSLDSNGSINLSVTVAADVLGQGELSYQWRRNGQAIENANAPTYQATTVGLYRLVITNWAGKTFSAVVAVTEPTPTPEPTPPAQAVPALVAQKHQSVKVKLPKRLKRNKVYKLPAKTRQGVAISYKVKGAGKCKINKKKRTITCKRTTAKKKFRLVGTAKATSTLYAYKVTIKRRVK